MNDFKNILVVGDSGVGKTTYLRRVSSGDFEEKHIQHYTLYYTEVLLDNNNLVYLYELPLKKYLTYDILKEFDAVIVMFDVSNVSTLFSAHSYWLENLSMKVRSTTPIILVGNKIDLKCDVTAEEICVIKRDGFTYFFGISCKTCFQIYEPLEIIFKL